MESDSLNIKRWVVMYPIYMNSKKTIAEGRRIATSKACENPTCIEIRDCCNHLKFPTAIELDKAFPRDYQQRGRVRVLLKKDDGTYQNPAITSRKDLMIRVSELIPKHPERVKKQNSSTVPIAGTSSKSGKGGKKKK